MQGLRKSVYIQLDKFNEPSKVSTLQIDFLFPVSISIRTYYLNIARVLVGILVTHVKWLLKNSIHNNMTIKTHNATTIHYYTLQLIQCVETGNQFGVA